MLVKDNEKRQVIFSSQQGMKAIDAFVIGCGTIGSALLAQICRQQARLLEQNIILTVYGIANSSQLILDEEGISLGNWEEQLNNNAVDNSHSMELVNLLVDFIGENKLLNPLLIDCTGSREIALLYESLLANNIHIVTANKIANGESFSFYQCLRKLALKQNKKFLYEANVGAGLPVIEPLQKLLRSGDSLLRFEGILSGSLSYIFGELEKGLLLSEATLKAKALGFTEPDPREDLNGMDVARKVLIIARESGLRIELADIQVESVLPKNYEELNAGDFLDRLPELDDEFKLRIEKAKSNQQVLRYVASIEGNKCCVAIKAVEETNPLYNVLDGENVLAFYTQYYQPKPLVIRGYGAGAEVTAAGVFSDVLRVID